ncbi:MAG: hemerythrin domain-containing protein [Gallionellaceae bacterium]|jgi:regulator of cell morphogenesis and NO signaling
MRAQLDLSETDATWSTRSLTDLIGFLLSHHHPYTKIALAELTPLLNKVVGVHGSQHPELLELEKLFIELREDMGAHLMKEENILFPYMLALESDVPPTSPFGSVAMPIRMMTMEHEHDSLILHKMRELSHHFKLPDEACTSHTTLYNGLSELVDDLLKHIYLENTIVFPKAIEIERQH